MLLLGAGCSGRCPSGTVQDGSACKWDPYAESEGPMSTPSASPASKENPAQKFGEAGGAPAFVDDQPQAGGRAENGGDAGTTIDSGAAMSQDSGAHTETEAACAQAGMIRCASQGVGARVFCKAGQWVEYESCSTGQVCTTDNGTSSCQALVALCKGHTGDSVCDDQGLMLECHQDGTASTLATCENAAVCHAGLSAHACAACVPGSHRCQGAALLLCAADGQAYTKLSDCKAAALCDETQGACQPAVCEAGQVKCTDDTLWQCNQSLSDWEKPKQCGLGLCDQANKRCRECSPGAKHCQEDTVLTCAAQGEGFLSSACDTSAPHCTGAGQCVQCLVDSDCRPTPCHVANCSDSAACALVPTPSEPKSTNLADGTLVLKATGERVWVVFGGAKFGVTDPDTLMRLYGGFGNVTMQSAEVVDKLPLIPVTGTTLVEENGDRVWRVEKGKLRHITSPDVLDKYCGGWGVVRTIPAGSLTDNKIPIGDPIKE
jgi:hypothetical protein